jgi:hypothetical protein
LPPRASADDTPIAASNTTRAIPVKTRFTIGSPFRGLRVLYPEIA